MIRLPSGRIEIALHTLAERSGPTLLGVHSLGGSHREFAGLTDAWPGAVHALDLAGHGASDRVRGRAYSAEDWAADADAALRQLGSVFLVGRGVGAYSALLLAGARPDSVHGTLLLSGDGLDGNGEHPDAECAAEDRALLKEFLAAEARADSDEANEPDPLVIETQSHHRPRHYARAFAQRAKTLLLAEGEDEKPPWWDELRGLPGTTLVSDEPRGALAELAKLAGAYSGSGIR